MGLFVLFKKKEPVAAPAPIAVPSKEEQEEMAAASLKLFLDQMYDEWNEDEDEFLCDYFDIAGITYYCNRSDVGMIRGLTFKDKSNPKDKSAIGIASIDDNGKQKLVGYIPKNDKPRYRKIAKTIEQCVFIGYIRQFTDSNGRYGLRGRVKVYAGNASSKGAYQSMLKDTKLLIGAFRGYIEEETFEDAGEKLEWVLDRRF